MDNIIIKFAGTLISGLKIAAASIVGRIMAGLGLSFASFYYVLPQVKSWLLEQSAGLDDRAITVLSAAGVDVFMTLIISALVARVGMKTVLMSAQALENMIGAAGG